MALTKIVDNVVIELTAEEIAEVEARVAAADLDFSGVRGERNGLLSNSDWTQIADSPADADAWATYRQSLRDLPQTYTRVSEVVWPTPPE
jgi:hypothetical protein